ncbi:unnamed protein product [Amoebophrya sp. A25]|nr:unnamed protein product [Amoebophrya sp. A25]|eukprot:GSA25T00006485001.1
MPTSPPSLEVENDPVKGANLISAAQQSKADGNDAYGRGEFTIAVKLWTVALRSVVDAGRFVLLDKGVQDLERTLYLNLAQGQLRCQNWTAAERACDVVLREDPKNEKALFRLGEAQLHSGAPVEEFQKTVGRLNDLGRASNGEGRDCPSGQEEDVINAKALAASLLAKYNEKQQRLQKQRQQNKQQMKKLGKKLISDVLDGSAEACDKDGLPTLSYSEERECSATGAGLPAARTSSAMPSSILGGMSSNAAAYGRVMPGSEDMEDLHAQIRAHNKSKPSNSAGGGGTWRAGGYYNIARTTSSSTISSVNKSTKKKTQTGDGGTSEVDGSTRTTEQEDKNCEGDGAAPPLELASVLRPLGATRVEEACHADEFPVEEQDKENVYVAAPGGCQQTQSRQNSVGIDDEIQDGRDDLNHQGGRELQEEGIQSIARALEQARRYQHFSIKSKSSLENKVQRGAKLFYLRHQAKNQIEKDWDMAKAEVAAVAEEQFILEDHHQSRRVDEEQFLLEEGEGGLAVGGGMDMEMDDIVLD